MNVDAELIVLPYEARQGRHLLDRLIDELESGRWSEFRAAVAFGSKTANFPGLINALEDFAAAGHTVTITFCARRFSGGTYATDFEAVETLVDIFEGHPNARVFLYGQPDITFHPKLYMFANNSSARLIVGSSNWSESGLVSNVEANVALTLDLDDDQARRTYDRVNDYFDRYWTG